MLYKFEDGVVGLLPAPGVRLVVLDQYDRVGLSLEKLGQDMPAAKPVEESAYDLAEHINTLNSLIKDGRKFREIKELVSI